MSPQNSNDSDTPSAAEQSSPAAFDLETLSPRQMRVVLVCDVVESVRWMEHDEDNAITRWSQFAAAVRSRIAPEHAGSVVKSTGDGLMLEFESAPQAVAAANAMQKLAGEGNAGCESERHMHLRIGIHQAQVRRDAHDLYGHGVNLAARISTLAGPGEIIVTPEVRDHLTDSLDGDIEDLGECYLKHLSEPQRVYRVAKTLSTNELSVSQSTDSLVQWRCSIAVLPFRNLSETSSSDWVYSELISDGLINLLSRSEQLKVVSKLSSRRLVHRDDAIQIANQRLAVDCVLTGSYAVQGEQILIAAQLINAEKDELIWTGRFKDSSADLFELNSTICSKLVEQAHTAMTTSNVANALITPLPNLSSYGLFLGALTLMHRAHKQEFHRAYALLEELKNRHPRHPIPRAWLAKWYVLKVAQGQSENAIADAHLAMDNCARALDMNPSSSLALAIAGQVNGYLKQDLMTAKSLYQQALDNDPNESLAWLWLGTNGAFLGDPAASSDLTERAIDLSPLDPISYYYKSLGASAAITAGKLDRAIELATDSIRLNRTHTSTYRALAIAQSLCGQVDAAKATIQRLLELEPNFSVSAFRARYPGRSLAPEFTNRLANALFEAGLPQ